MEGTLVRSALPSAVQTLERPSGRLSVAGDWLLVEAQSLSNALSLSSLSACPLALAD